MIRNEKKLKLAISIYNEMDDISWNNNEVVGKIQLNQDNLDKLFAFIGFFSKVRIIFVLVSPPLEPKINH